MTHPRLPRVGGRPIMGIPHPVPGGARPLGLSTPLTLLALPAQRGRPSADSFPIHMEGRPPMRPRAAVDLQSLGCQ